MGFFDKIKGAVNAVTGGAARVTIEIAQPVIVAGEPVAVRITATSTGAEVKSGGVFVDVRGQESVDFKHGEQNTQVTHSETTFKQTFSIAPAFVLAPNETKKFEGTFQLPPSALPSFAGKLAKFAYSVCGRIETFGNDPDSGFQPVRVTNKN
jgi:hypothetical protein